MKINRKELLEVLKLVQPGLAKQDIISQSTSFVFSNGRVFTFNDEIAVSHPVKIDIEAAVPAKELFGLLNKVKTEEIELEIIEKDGTEQLMFKGSRAKAGLRIESEIKLPIDELGEPDEWLDLPDNFCEAIAFSLFTASKDQSTPVLTCLHITNGYVESTDNYRVTRYQLADSEAFEEETLIPAFAAKEIVAYKPTVYSRTEGWMHFKNDDDVMYSCRVFDEEFPDVSDILSQDGDEIEFPKNLTEILGRAAIMSDGERVTVTIDDNKMKIYTEGEAGWFEELVRVDYEGDSVTFDIQPEFLDQILKHTTTAIIGDTLMFEEEGVFVHVVSTL